MPLTRQEILAVAVAAWTAGLASLAVLLAAWRPWAARRDGAGRGGWGGAAALGLAFAGGFLSLMQLRGRFDWRAFDASPQRWLVYATLIVGGLAALADGAGLPGAWRRLAGVVAVLWAVWLAAGTYWRAQWLSADAAAGRRSIIGAAAGFATAAAAFWLLLDLLAQRRGAGRMAWVLFLTTIGAAGVISMLDSMILATNAAPLGAALAATALAGWWAAPAQSRANSTRRNDESSPARNPGAQGFIVSPGLPSAGGSLMQPVATGLSLVFTVVLVQVVARAFIDSAISDESPTGAPLKLGLVCSAPLLAWVTQIPPLRRLRPWVRVLAESAAALALLGLALALAHGQFVRESAAAGY